VKNCVFKLVGNHISFRGGPKTVINKNVGTTEINESKIKTCMEKSMYSWTVKQILICFLGKYCLPLIR
jgi:hypothetical protein